MEKKKVEGKSLMRWLDILAWIGFGIVVVYLIGKAVGLIHSPPAIDLAAILSGAFFIGRYTQKIDMYSQKIDAIYEDSKEIKKDVEKIKTACPAFKK